MKTAQNTQAIDVTWIALLVITFLMWWADQHAATDASLLGMALLKNGLIGSVFMGLLRTSKVALMILMVFLSLLGALLLALLP